tara:strand:- start:26279 stop:26548 length:270 start_codon:yes stop_codon:yes gene_type:complete
MTRLSSRSLDRIIQMCWEDRTPFDMIKTQFSLSEKEIISIMRNNLRKESFIRWRKRIDGRKTKHSALMEDKKHRFKSKSQREISYNKFN